MSQMITYIKTEAANFYFEKIVVVFSHFEAPATII